VKRYEFENRTIPWKNAKGDSVLLTYVFNEDQSYEYMLEARFRVPVKGGVDLITGEAIDPGKIVMPPWGARLIEWTPATD
jgi:hypothetical protein